MSIDVISKDIFFDAQKEKDRLFLEQKEEFSLVQSESDKRIESLKSGLYLEHNLSLKEQEENILGLAKKVAKGKILQVKCDLIKKTRDDLDFELVNLKKDQREDILKVLVEKSKEVFDFDEVICSKRDLVFVKSQVSKDVKVSIFPNLNGLKFVRENGREVLDLTFESLIDEIFEIKDEEVQKVLF